jgi:hypothetical protein
MRWLYLASAVFAGLLLAAKSAPAQDNKGNAAQANVATPGPIHKEMAKRAGEYTTHSKFSFKPGAPAQETDGSSKLTMILGGRYLQDEHMGTLLGMPVSSLHLYGFNNATQNYEAVWMYTGHTGFMSMSGKSSDDGKTINYAASYDGEDGKKVNLDMVFRNIDDDHFSVALIAKGHDGGQGPTLETTYSRKK